MEHESHIVLDGTSNVRDLSWTLGNASRLPGSGFVLRSANLDRLSPGGRRRFGELGIGVVIDLRGKVEAAAAPEFEGTMRVHLPIEPTVVAEILAHHAAGTLGVATAVGVMEDTYRRYIVDHAAVFAEVLHRVLSARRRRVLLHCAAGKDRTGVAAALVLTALGVPRPAIMEDYLLSNRLYRPAEARTLGIPDDVRHAVLRVRPSYLESAFAATVAGWGGPQNYLENELGIGAREREAMREAIV